MDTLRWLRVVGDTIFAAGMVALGWFVMGLKTGWSITGERDAVSAARPTDYSGRAIRVGDVAARRLVRGASRRLLESHFLCVHEEADQCPPPTSRRSCRDDLLHELSLAERLTHP